MAFGTKKIDMTLVKKAMDPKAAGDLNAFIEALPQNAGQTVLIAAGIAWAMAGALGLYASVQATTLTELRGKLMEAEALTPIVPKIQDVPISTEEVTAFSKDAEKAYPNLTFSVNGSTIIITSPRTADFAMFRESVGHMQNGGSGWRVSLDKLCVGRECDQSHKLAVALRVNKVSVENR
jgi:hypothetical protein